jgi:hypothetical protein
MCRRITCSTCGKPTFAGCGAHVEQVLGDVPPDQRCRCREQPPKPTDEPSDTGVRGRLRDLFGRG